MNISHLLAKNKIIKHEHINKLDVMLCIAQYKSGSYESKF
jgi:hypothetical protein